MRCSQCRHVWHQEPEAEEPAEIQPIVEHEAGLELAPHPEAETAEQAETGGVESPTAEPDEPEAAESPVPEAAEAESPGAVSEATTVSGRHPARAQSGPQLEPAGEDARGFAAPRKKQRKSGARLGLALGWALFIILIGGMAAGAVLYRQKIIDYLPPDAKQQAASVYDWLGLPFELPGFGLKIEVTRSVRESRDDVPLLVIEGRITNISKKARALPRLRAALQDGDDREIQHWFFRPGEERLLSGQSAEFRTSVDNPDTAAKNLSIIFVRNE